jgi:Spy/CpxP family protein refolding chaperone
MTKGRGVGIGAALAFTLAGLAGLVLAAPAPPEGPEGTGAGSRGPKGRPALGARTAEYLGLSEQQKASFREMQRQHRTEMEPLWAEGRELRRKLREATEAPSPDATAVGEAMLALRAHHEKVKAQRGAFEQKLVAQLTPEQKQKWEALRAARELGRGGRHARRAGRDAGRDARPAVE